jgi:hypothetical protein
LRKSGLVSALKISAQTLSITIRNIKRIFLNANAATGALISVFQIGKNMCDSIFDCFNNLP